VLQDCPYGPYNGHNGGQFLWKRAGNPTLFSSRKDFGKATDTRINSRLECDLKVFANICEVLLKPSRFAVSVNETCKLFFAEKCTV
jgi:hypothetical protein